MTAPEGFPPRQDAGPAENPYAASQVPWEDSRFVAEPAGKLNPWLSIWIRPRATMRQILDTDPTRLVLLLAALGGMAQALDRASMRSLADQMPLAGILVMAIVVGPIVGIISLYIGGMLMRITGKWLGGVGSAVDVRAALAWGQVPSIWALLLWIPNLALFGAEMFSSETPRIDSDTGLLAALMVIGLVELVIGVWQIVVVLKCIGEAQRFSAWSALGAVLLAGLLVVAVLLIPIAVIFGLSLALSG